MDYYLPANAVNGFPRTEAVPNGGQACAARDPILDSPATKSAKTEGTKGAVVEVPVYRFFKFDGEVAKG